MLRPLQRQAPLARERLQALLKHVCLRRSKTMTVRRDGVEQPLVALPPKTVEVVVVEATPAQQSLSRKAAFGVRWTNRIDLHELCPSASWLTWFSKPYTCTAFT